ncbi:MAG: HupE/UreJ family protein, partial [Planctomycetota bacterium]
TANRRSAAWPSEPGARLEAEGPLRFYTGLGWGHVLEGHDHLAFLLALLLGVSGAGALLLAVTAFTLAHSVTLALSALGVFSLPPAVVEPGISASILFVAWLHMVQGPGRARPWLAAFPFGLLHGFGFAGALGEIGIPPGETAPALLGFNLGVELGQLTFLVPVAAGVALFRSRFDAGTRSTLRGLGAAVIGAAGLHFTARAVTGAWLEATLAGWPAALRPLPAGLAITLLLWLWLRGRRTPSGEPVGPALRLSVVLWLLYLGGGLLGTALR